MEFPKIILIMATSMALSISLTIKISSEVEEKPPFEHNNNIDSLTTFSKGFAIHEEKNPIMSPSKRLSRFLVDDKNPRAAHHCHKHNEICKISRDNYHNKTLTCCNNKCMDLSTDRNNCGACKRKCDYTEDCCRRQCVTLAFDKKHSGRCNNRCPKHELCVYGMCNYP